MPLTTAELLKRVRGIELRSRRLVTDALSGAYHSVFKGQGIDFEEVREYQPGDDVRALDWNVTARMDRPFIKTFREERELTVVLVVDVSASGNYGSVEDSKRQRAAEVACVLALAAARNQDKAGLLLYSDHVEQLILPRKGRGHILRLVREIMACEPQGRRTDLTSALETLHRVLHRHALVFILSDFIDPGWQGPLQQQLGLIARRHDVTALRLEDPREADLPNIGLVTMEDAETGQLLEVDTGDALVRQRFRQAARERREFHQQELRRLGISQLTISTARPYINDLRRHLEQRSHRRR